MTTKNSTLPHLVIAKDALAIRHCGVCFPTVPSSVKSKSSISLPVPKSNLKWASIAAEGMWVAMRKNFLTLRMSNCLNVYIITFSTDFKKYFNLFQIPEGRGRNLLALGP